MASALLSNHSTNLCLLALYLTEILSFPKEIISKRINEFDLEVTTRPFRQVKSREKYECRQFDLNVEIMGFSSLLLVCGYVAVFAFIYLMENVESNVISICVSR